MPPHVVEGKTTESLWVVLLVFLKVGAFTFGGGYAMLPIFQREVVEKQHWVDEQTFSDFLIITQSMPGQIALNTAIQIGIRIRGNLGGLVAAFGVTAPSVIILLLIAAYFYPLLENNEYVQAIFYGLRPAVVALITATALKMGKEILSGLNGIILCATLLLIIIMTGLHPILALLTGGLAGLFFCRGGGCD
ncbi:MAG: chromate transporter [Bacillota bacterium]|nr:chromate transporter [Bacillota bacterium]